jgi:hypothetical protein
MAGATAIARWAGSRKKNSSFKQREDMSSSVSNFRVERRAVGAECQTNAKPHGRIQAYGSRHVPAPARIIAMVILDVRIIFVKTAK